MKSSSYRKKRNCNAENILTRFFKNMKILKLQEVHKYSSWIYIYKTLFHNPDVILNRKLFAQNENHTHNTRRNNKLFLSGCNRSKTQFSIFYTVVKCFNVMPATVYLKQCILKWLQKRVTQLLHQSIPVGIGGLYVKLIIGIMG